MNVRILGLRACPASTRLGIVHAEGVISTGLRFNPVGHLFNAHPPPLPQARREEEGLPEDAAELSHHWGVDDNRGLQLPGWLDPGAVGRDALPRLITAV